MTKIDRKITVAASAAKAPYCLTSEKAPTAGKAVADLIFAHIHARDEVEPGWGEGCERRDLVDAARHLASGKLQPGNDVLADMVTTYVTKNTEWHRLHDVLSQAEKRMPSWVRRFDSPDVLGKLYVHLAKAKEELRSLAEEANDSWFEREVERRVARSVEQARSHLSAIHLEAYDAFGYGQEERTLRSISKETEDLLSRIWGTQKRVKTFAGIWAILALYDYIQGQEAAREGVASREYPARAIIQDAMARIMALAHPHVDLVAAE
jgi:hypothetical protein